MGLSWEGGRKKGARGGREGKRRRAGGEGGRGEGEGGRGGKCAEAAAGNLKKTKTLLAGCGLCRPLQSQGSGVSDEAAASKSTRQGSNL